jgi:anti-sigma-K factor RskA
MHEETQELLGAYALDAVNDDERDLVDRHLRECARCRAEVAEHREAAALLAHGAPAPAGLWDQISGAIAGVPPEKKLAPMVRAGRWRGGWAAAAAVAAVAAAVTGFLGFRLVQQGDQIDRINTLLAATGLEGAASKAAQDPTSLHVSLVAEEGSTLATVVLLPDGKGYLLRPLLPALSNDRTYQLWALVGKATVSAGVLGNRPSVTAFSVQMPVDGFALSEERHGGVPVPQTPPIAIGKIETS